MNQYLIAANTKKGQLIFNMFRMVDLIIAGSGAAVTLILFLIIQPGSLLPGIIVLLPLMVCAFLVMPIPNYHNMLCFLTNIYNYYCVDINELKWKGWCFKDEYNE